MFIRREYKDLDNYKTSSLFKVKIKDNLVPQGICYVEDYILISCYSDDGNNSEVVFFNMRGEIIKEIILNNNSHVGGISYDSKNDLIWLCDKKGYISSYLYQDFKNGNCNNKASYLVADNSLGGGFLKEDGHLACSYLTYDDNKIFVGSFNKKCNGLVKIFEIVNNNNNIKLKYLNEFIVPSKTQGLAFLAYNDSIYLFLSRSYTRVKDSSLLATKYIKNKYDYIDSLINLTLPPMLEQISIDKSNNLMLLFESFAKKYSYNAKVVINDIYLLDSIKIIKELNL